MNVDLYIPLGTSEPQDVALLDEGVAYPGTGLTVDLVIKRYENAQMLDVDTPPTVAWLDQAAGTVRVTGVEDLAEGHYYVRFELTNGAGDIGYVPNGKSADLWSVVPVANR